MQDHAKIFKALADENRIKILEYIQAKCSEPCEGSCQPNDACASDLAKVLSITPATTSHHIKELVNAGLIITHKQGRWVYCRLNEEVFSRAIGFLNNLRKEET